MASVSYYQTLQIRQDATQAEIAAAYRQLARRFHPDLNPSPDAHRQMQVINEAYNILRHPERRQRYDETLAPPVTPHRSQAQRAPRRHPLLAPRLAAARRSPQHG
jgi:DnaJ-class molecular chaperone